MKHTGNWVICEKRRKYSSAHHAYVTLTLTGPHTFDVNQAKRFRSKAQARALLFALGWDWLVVRQLPGWMV